MGAVEAALRCHHGGARVSISYRGDRFPEESIKYYKKAVEQAQKEKRNSVLLLLNRDGDVRFVAIKLDDGKKK